MERLEQGDAVERLRTLQRAHDAERGRRVLQVEGLGGSEDEGSEDEEVGSERRRKRRRNTDVEDQVGMDSGLQPQDCVRRARPCLCKASQRAVRFPDSSALRRSRKCGRWISWCTRTWRARQLRLRQSSHRTTARSCASSLRGASTRTWLWRIPATSAAATAMPNSSPNGAPISHTVLPPSRPRTPHRLRRARASPCSALV